MITERKKLLETLTKMMPGIDSKELVASMTQLHFTGKSLISYNDAVYVRCNLPTEFQCSVHARTLYNLLKQLDTEKVKLELVDNRLRLNTLGIAADLTIGEGTEINEILNALDKEIKTLKTIEPLPTDFLKAVELCSFSAMTKDIGGSFTCINVSDHYVMSSDRSRFSLFRMETTMAEIMFKAVVVPDLVKYDLKLYSATKGWIHFFESKDGLVFSVRRYSGEFPTKEIILYSNANPNPVKVALPEEVLSSLGLMGIFTEGQQQKYVQVTANDGQLIMKVSGINGTVTKKFKIDTKKNFTFNINPVFLTEILKRGMKVIEVNSDREQPMAFFRSKNFTHAIALMS